MQLWNLQCNLIKHEQHTKTKNMKNIHTQRITEEKLCLLLKKREHFFLFVLLRAFILIQN